MFQLTDSAPAALSSDGKTAIIVVVAGIVGGAITWLAGEWRKIRAEAKGDAAAEEKKITDHLNRLVDRLDKELAEREREKNELAAETRALISRVSRREILISALRLHVKYLERMLHDNHISFEPFADPPESADPDHTPLATAASGVHVPLAPLANPNPTGS